MLELTDVVTTYGAVRALDGVTLAVPDGTILAVLGANGAGKTTLLRSINGLVRARSGAISYDGHDLRATAIEDVVALGIAHVPEGRGVIVELTVEENLRLGALWRGDRAECADSLAEVYRMFPPLAERKSRVADTLSGGERQMLALGRALMSEPELLMLDEPSLGLAPAIVDALYDTLQRLHRDGLTLLLAEQSVPLALAIADYAYVLQTGRTVLEGPAADLARDPQVQRIYLGIKDNPALTG
jgi:branched-chain amino acid transport system ATP-binding protein